MTPPPAQEVGDPGRSAIKGRLLAIVICIDAAVILSVIKASSLPPTAFLITRALSQLLVCCSVFSLRTQLTFSRSVRPVWRTLTARSLCGSLAMAGFYSVTAITPLAKIGVLMQLNPIFAAILSFFILQEMISLPELLFGTLALVGAVLVIQPPFIFTPDSFQSSDRDLYGSAILLASVMLQSVGIVMTRKLGKQEVDWVIPLLLQSATLLLVSVCLHVAFTGSLVARLAPCCLLEGAYLVTVMGVGFLNHVVIYFANKFEKSAVVSVFFTFKAVLLLGSDLVLFPETISFNLLHYSGGAVVLLSVIALFLSKSCGLDDRTRLRHCCRCQVDSDSTTVDASCQQIGGTKA